MNKNYELTLLMRPDVADENVRIVLQGLRDVIINNGGSMIYAEYWGLRQLEYKINKCDASHFYMLQIESNKEINDLLDERLRNSDMCIRYLLVVVENSEELKLKTPNRLSSQDQAEDGVVFDKRFYNILSSILPQIKVEM